MELKASKLRITHICALFLATLSMNSPVAADVSKAGSSTTNVQIKTDTKMNSLYSLQELGERFRTMRLEKGHFEGGKRQSDLDQWGGTKHAVMQSLARQVIKEKLSPKQLTELMGEPDLRVGAGHKSYETLTQQTEWKGKPSGNYWVYFWRGAHDQLLFAYDGNIPVAGGWLYAYE